MGMGARKRIMEGCVLEKLGTGYQQGLDECNEKKKKKKTSSSCMCFIFAQMKWEECSEMARKEMDTENPPRIACRVYIC
jgi:hypothetical protein